MEPWIKQIYYFALRGHSIKHLAIIYPVGKPAVVCVTNPINTIQKHIDMIK